MSQHRIDPRAGWMPSQKKLDVCRCGCGQAVPKGRRTFASDACVHEWKIRTQPPYVRACVLKRDHEVCARCGIDFKEVRAELDDMARSIGLWTWSRSRLYDYSDQISRWIRFWQRQISREWQAHHRHAVVEGGGLCGLDGYETLCRRCHKLETAALRKRMKEKKRGEGNGAT